MKKLGFRVGGAAIKEWLTTNFDHELNELDKKGRWLHGFVKRNRVSKKKLGFRVVGAIREIRGGYPL